MFNQIVSITCSCNPFISFTFETELHKSFVHCARIMIIGIIGSNSICAVCNLWPVFEPKFMEYNPSRIEWDLIRLADSIDNDPVDCTVNSEIDCPLSRTDPPQDPRLELVAEPACLKKCWYYCDGI